MGSKVWLMAHHHASATPTVWPHTGGWQNCMSLSVQGALSHQDAMRRAVRGDGGSQNRRTLLIIAHRIDTILDCDQLLVKTP